MLTCHHRVSLLLPPPRISVSPPYSPASMSLNLFFLTMIPLIIDDEEPAGHVAVLMCCRGGGTQSEARWRYNWSGGDARPGAFSVPALRKRLQAPCLADPAPRSASQPDYLHRLPHHSQS